MIRKLALLALPLLAACSGTVAADETAAADNVLTKIYSGYSRTESYDFSNAVPYSRATATLIAQWKKSLDPSGEEVDELSDFDWMCECQDWDAKKFKLHILPHAAPADGKAEVTARIDLGFDGPRDERFTLVKEGGAWKVDELHSVSFPTGLKAALAGAIAHPQAE